ncbi:cadherin domain containing protein [Streptomyces azureus]|uniref:Cadherin domain containing protein n=1 Tax=Streptomyces azureus TaxID=146537 RepID=A0A0K8PDI4_STRAJ|nr:cadherin domain containing protein [Streptomyces azureus]
MDAAEVHAFISRRSGASETQPTAGCRSPVRREAVFGLGVTDCVRGYEGRRRFAVLESDQDGGEGETTVRDFAPRNMHTPRQPITFCVYQWSVKGQSRTR